MNSAHLCPALKHLPVNHTALAPKAPSPPVVLMSAFRDLHLVTAVLVQNWSLSYCAHSLPHFTNKQFGGRRI